MNVSMDQVVSDLASRVEMRPATLAASGKPSFCEYWPVARPVLEALSVYLPAVGWLVKLIIAVGDKACSKS